MSSVEEFAPAVRGGEEAEAEVVDFRMITFTLGGRDYGFDIMAVKEISKVSSYTYVPNTSAFVRGVYNLRGEIISIIDLRVMFHLPVQPRPEGEPDDVLFLRSGDHLVGVIVDAVNDVVGVSSARIQPPHPLFGEINIRYISGVVESRDTLYVILDSEMVFGDRLEVEQPAILERRAVHATPKAAKAIETGETPAEVQNEDLDYTFVSEALETFRSFSVSPLNETWMRGRFKSWVTDRTAAGKSVQLQSAEDAVSYLKPFFSTYSGTIWGSDYIKGVLDLLPDFDTSSIGAWVIGAGEGYDAYSLACVLRKRYPEASLSVWAHDSDLLKISTAPTMTFDLSTIPTELRDYVIETPRGHMFAETIRESIYFEYHNVDHDNSFPEVQIVLARDYLSFQPEAARTKLLTEIPEKLVEGGLVILGTNERFSEDTWKPIESGGVHAYSIG